jgi:4-amino-4-deoxy-L-arabinose transferase-like glycosyltransferase
MPILAAIIAAAVVLRVASALWQGNTIALLPGIQDQVSYDTLARQLLAGKGFTFPVDWWPVTQAGEPTAHWSFLYTLYLAAVYGVFGPQPLVARVFQAVIAGVLLPWLTWRVGRRVFGDTVGLMAAAISAVYVYFFYYAGALMTETFYIVSILWTMDSAMRIAAAGPASFRHWLPWLELGLAMGVAILLLSWALIRYRLPVDAVLIIFAGVGLVQVVERIRTVTIANSVLDKEGVRDESAF